MEISTFAKDSYILLNISQQQSADWSFPAICWPLSTALKASLPSKLARLTQVHRGGGFRHPDKTSFIYNNIRFRKEEAAHPPSLWKLELCRDKLFPSCSLPYQLGLSTI